MTAAELCCAFLDHKLIPVKEEEFWSCWEVSDKEEMGENQKLYGWFNFTVEEELHFISTRAHVLERAFMRKINVT